MKKGKRVWALALASVMTLALAAPSWADPAANDATIRVETSGEEPSNAVFSGYQLLEMYSELIKSDCHTNPAEHKPECYNVQYKLREDSKYNNIMLETAEDSSVKNEEWTSESRKVTVDNLVAYLSVMTPAEAQTFGDVLYRKIVEANKAGAEATPPSIPYEPDVTGINSSSATKVAQGWWLFVDTRSSDNLNDEQESRSVVILKTHGQTNIVISPKSDSPELDKNIVEVTGTDVELTDHTSEEIGSKVKFRLTADNLPSPARLESYDTYKCEFHDTLSVGLKYVENSVKVYIQKKGATTLDAVASGLYTFDPKTDKDPSGKDMDVLTITVTDLKKLAGWGEGSKLIVEYEALLTPDAAIGNDGNKNKAYLKYSNDPYNSGSGDPLDGQTPDDEVAVFTFEIDGTKEDAYDEKVKLQGAEFVLYKEEGGKTLYAEFENGKISWSELEQGENADSKQFNQNRKLTSGKDGKFAIKGLEAGESETNPNVYYLLEINAPSGYNLLKGALKLEVWAKYEDAENEKEAPTLKEWKVKVSEIGNPTSTADQINGDVASGTANITIKNSTGTQLPETGGMGTTLIYLAGGVLAAGALILLALKKRRNGEK